MTGSEKAGAGEEGPVADGVTEASRSSASCSSFPWSSLTFPVLSSDRHRALSASWAAAVRGAGGLTGAASAGA